MKLSMMLSLVAAGIFSAGLVFASDEVFTSAAYDWAVTNKDIIRAARCEATDVALYGKQRLNYEARAGVIGFSSGKGSHQCLEYILAYRYLNNYYRGYVAALEVLSPEIRTKTLTGISSDLDCEAVNDLPKTKY